MARTVTSQRRSKKLTLGQLPPQDDPRAPLDPAQLLKAAQPLLKALDADLLERAKASVTDRTYVE